MTSIDTTDGRTHMAERIRNSDDTLRTMKMKIFIISFIHHLYRRFWILRCVLWCSGSHNENITRISKNLRFRFVMLMMVVMYCVPNDKIDWWIDDRCRVQIIKDFQINKRTDWNGGAAIDASRIWDWKFKTKCCDKHLFNLLVSFVYKAEEWDGDDDSELIICLFFLYPEYMEKTMV